MNICFVTRFYPPDTGGGGIAAYTRYAALGLLRRGHQVSVISQMSSQSKSKPFQQIDGVNIYRIPSVFSSYRWTRLPIIGRHFRFMRNVVYAARAGQALTRLSMTFTPEITEYADIEAEGLFHPPVSPYVVKLHVPHAVLRPYYTSHQVPYARRGIEALEARAVRRADGVSSPSNWLAKEVASLYDLDNARISRVPNSIDTDFYSPSVGPNGTPQSVLYVGRLEPRKGAQIFAQAIPAIAQACPKTRFTFLGADRPGALGVSQKAELEAYFEEERVRDKVHFHGHATPEVFRDFYRLATVFVMPSLFENCPYTLLEAMACGKPAVVSRAGGMTEMIEDGKTGLLFEKGDSEALAEKVVELLKFPSLRAELGQTAREAILQRYSLDIGAEATEKFYQDVLD